MPPKKSTETQPGAKDVPATDALVVCATKPGWYGNVMRQPGDVFRLERAAHMSQRWMAPADGRGVAPRALSDAEKAHKAIMAGAATKLQPNAADPIPVEPVAAESVSAESATGNQSVI